MSDNNWGTFKVQQPSFVTEGALTGINDLVNALVGILDVGIAYLEYGKAFAPGRLDPLTPVVEALVNEVNATLKGIYQTGAYITSDVQLIGKPSQMQGGFAEYERRMIAKLTDRTDATRPDVSANTPTLAAYFYLSVPQENWAQLVNFVKGLTAYFNQDLPPQPSPYPVPDIRRVLYGSQTSGLLMGNFTEAFALTATPPNTAVVKWGITPSIQRAPFSRFPAPAPGGFIVTVSTLPDGIDIVYDRPRSGTTTRAALADSSKQVQPREYGRVITPDGKPLTLFGGAEMIEVPSDLGYNIGVKDNRVKDGAIRVYGTSGSGKRTIPLEKLKQGDKYYFQRTFYVTPDTVMDMAWATGEFFTRLSDADMPRQGRVVEASDGTLDIEDDGASSTVYVRVAVCSPDIVKNKNFKYTFETGMVGVTGKPLGASESEGSSTSMGGFSLPRTVVFANTNTNLYLDALKNALTVLALSRPDLIPFDTLTGADYPQSVLDDIRNNKKLLPHVALYRSGLEPFMPIVERLFDGNYRSYIEGFSDTTPVAFRTRLADRIEQVAQDIYSATGPMPDVEAFIAKETETLRTKTWGDLVMSAHPNLVAVSQTDDQTLFASLSDANKNAGVGKNPYSFGVDPTVISDQILPFSMTLDRDPQMQVVHKVVSDPFWLIPLTVSASETQAFLSNCPPGLKILYEKCVQPDGSISVPQAWRTGPPQGLDAVTGSADLSPVYILQGKGQSLAKRQGWVLYCRGLFAKAFDGEILSQAALVLGVAASASKKLGNEGAWQDFRLFDIYPEWEQWLATVSNWAESIQVSIGSAEDNTSAAIQTLEAKVVELQQLIQRIDALIQNFNGFTFLLPQCAALVTLSNGTGGVLADLVSAKNKPADSPLNYGGGVLLVVPVPAGGLVLDLLRAILVVTEGDPQPGVALSESPTSAGIGNLPVVPTPSSEPDVL